MFVSLGLLICSASCQLEFAKYDFGFENNLDGVYIEGITNIYSEYCLNDLSHWVLLFHARINSLVYEQLLLEPT